MRTLLAVVKFPFLILFAGFMGWCAQVATTTDNFLLAALCATTLTSGVWMTCKAVFS